MGLKNIAPGPLQRYVMKRWYDFVAARFQLPEWKFMNFGYAGVDAASPCALAVHEEPDRCCIQLYDHVAGAALLSGKDVLEVGSGRGGGAAWLARTYSPRSYTGLDYAPSAVSLCSRLHDFPGLSFTQGNAESLPFEDGSFDVVLNVESSHEYGRMDRFLAEVARVLRPGGVFSWADFRGAELLPSLEQHFVASGLVPVRSFDITASVLLALDQMREHRLGLIRAHVPWYFRGLLREFAAVRGSETYESLASGRRVYLSRAFRKPQPSVPDRHFA
jgi:ubiquinone/menaquinone biosynthesis C-methylase UbiE